MGIVAFAAMFLGLAWRLARVGVYIRGADLKIINPLKTFIVPLSQISEFRLDDLPAPLLGGLQTVVVVARHDGTQEPIWSLMLRNTPLPSQAVAKDEAVERLNQLLMPPKSSA